MTFADADYPAVPYPGARPACSYVHHDATGHPLRPDHATPAGWRVEDGRDLDEWLADRDAAPLAERVPLLCYGSNACPAKLTWLRGELGLPGPAVLLRARCAGLAAVWAAGLRVVNDQRPATLAAMAGVAEVHAVWLATPEQVRVLDRCEGRGSRYRLAHVRTGEVRLDDGAVVDRPLAYVAAPGGAGRTAREPLLVDGAPVRCAEVPQTAAAALAGEPAPGDGLSLLVVEGAPVPTTVKPGSFPPRADDVTTAARRCSLARPANVTYWDARRRYRTCRGCRGLVAEQARSATRRGRPQQRPRWWPPRWPPSRQLVCQSPAASL